MPAQLLHPCFARAARTPAVPAPQRAILSAWVMPSDPFIPLLDQLNAGNDQAAAEAFVVLEPVLRALVRRQLGGCLRASVDPADVVQMVWFRLLASFRSGGRRFRATTHLHAAIFKVTRNWLREHVRGLHHELDHEFAEVRPDFSARGPASPDDGGQECDPWERLRTLCPPAHRHLLAMRQAGLSLTEIALRSGLPESSVRRIFCELSRQFVRTSWMCS